MPKLSPFVYINTKTSTYTTTRAARGRAPKKRAFAQAETASLRRYPRGAASRAHALEIRVG